MEKVKIFNEGYNDLTKLKIVKARGSWIYDSFGKTYLDLAMGAGTHILGHAPSIIQNITSNIISNGTLYCLPNLTTYAYGELLKEITKFNSFVFCNSGSEATMRAIRIARAYTEKPKIGVFSGGWYGSHDMVLLDDDYNSPEYRPSAIGKAGVPEELVNLAVMLPYNDDNAFNIIEENANDLAIIIIEPAQGSNPRDDMKFFLEKLREVTKRNNILLCFDEMITGFRVTLGGGQEYYNIKSDLATYGKIAGGGFPIGIVGGKKEYMQVIEDKNVFMGGTFSANPLSIGAGFYMVSHLARELEVHKRISSVGNYLKNEINEFCINCDIPVRMIGINSMLRLVFTDYPIRNRRDRDKYELQPEIQNRFYKRVLEDGIHVAGNRINFISTEHTDSGIEKVIYSFTKNLLKLRKEL